MSTVIILEIALFVVAIHAVVRERANRRLIREYQRLLADAQSAMERQGEGIDALTSSLHLVESQRDRFLEQLERAVR